MNNIKGDPHNANIIYAATGGGGICSGTPFGVGIICSTDAGATWNVIYSEQLGLSYYILVDPTAPVGTERIYIGFGGNVIRMVNNGSAWTDTIIYQNTDPYVRYIRDIEMKPGNPEILYIATDDKHDDLGRNKAQVFKLTGVTTGNTPTVEYFNPFQNSLNCQRYEIAVSSLTPNSLFVIGDIFTNNGAVWELWKSVNSGATWNQVYSESYIYGNDFPDTALGGGDVAYSKMELLISLTDTNVLYVGGNSMTRLIYSNGQWKKEYTTPYTGPSYHADTREVFFVGGSVPGSHGTHDTIICGNDGGVSKTINGITNWINLNGTGLWANEFWGIGSSEKNPYWIGGGTTHTGFFVNTNSNWQCTNEGDDGPTIVDCEQPNIVYMLPNLNYVSPSSTYGIRLFPNPASQYVIADYNYSNSISSKEDLVLSIFTSDGKIVRRIELNKLQDQLLIDCRNLDTGTYLCRINKGKKMLGSAKFVIVK